MGYEQKERGVMPGLPVNINPEIASTNDLKLLGASYSKSSIDCHVC